MLNALHVCASSHTDTSTAGTDTKVTASNPALNSILLQEEQFPKLASYYNNLSAKRLDLKSCLHLWDSFSHLTLSHPLNGIYHSYRESTLDLVWSVVFSFVLPWVLPNSYIHTQLAVNMVPSHCSEHDWWFPRQTLWSGNRLHSQTM